MYLFPHVFVSCTRMLLVCHSYFTLVLLIAPRMLLVSTRMSLVCSCMLLIAPRMLLVCTRVLLVAPRMLLVCTRVLLIAPRMLFVCYSYALICYLYVIVQCLRHDKASLQIITAHFLSLSHFHLLTVRYMYPIRLHYLDSLRHY